MGRVKEQLLDMEYKLMKLETINYYCIVDIKTEFVGEAYEQNNHYLVTYTIMELNSLEQITITEKIRDDLISDKASNGLNGTLASIMLENGVEPYQMNYYHLCKYGFFNHQCDNIHDYCISPSHYFFNGIPLKDPITSWEHILHIPSSERQQQRLLTEINNNLVWVANELESDLKSVNETLTGIDKALDLMNYLAQG